jgi:RNA recognition motif-containing protein
VDIIKDRDTGPRRGFGFVEMANTADGENAIVGLNGALLGDRTLNVNEAIADQSEPRGMDSGQKRPAPVRK